MQLYTKSEKYTNNFQSYIENKYYGQLTTHSVRKIKYQISDFEL